MKWLRNWIWFKKTWLLRKYHVGYCSTRGTVHRLVHGSELARTRGRTRFGHGLPSILVADAEMSEKHYVEHLVCIGGARAKWIAGPRCAGCCGSRPGVSGYCSGVARVLPSWHFIEHLVCSILGSEFRITEAGRIWAVEQAGSELGLGWWTGLRCWAGLSEFFSF